MSKGGAAAKAEAKKEHHHHHHRHDPMAAGETEKKEKKRHHHDKITDAQGTKKEKKHHHHHHHDETATQASPTEPVVDKSPSTVPCIVISPSSPPAAVTADDKKDTLSSGPVLSQDLQARAEAATKELAENHDHLNPEHSATLDHMLATDRHADIAKRIFKKTTSGKNLEVLVSQGDRPLKEEMKPLPEHHGMVIDEVTRTWRRRTTQEQIVFETEELKKKEEGKVNVKPT